jgi:hypothetical protein
MPVAIVMAGGYARDISNPVDVHHATVELTAQFHSAKRQSRAVSSLASR